jgi:hypothetical protein
MSSLAKIRLGTYTAVGVVVVVIVLVPGTFRYERQNVVAGGPNFFRALRAPVTFAQSTARSCRLASGVGSGRAATSLPIDATRKSSKTIMVAGLDMLCAEKVEGSRQDSERPHVLNTTINSPPCAAGRWRVSKSRTVSACTCLITGVRTCSACS